MATKKLTTSEAILGTKEKIKEVENRGRKAYLKPNEKKNAQTTILLRPTTKENLRELAWQRRTSLNELINQICEDYLKKNFKG